MVKGGEARDRGDLGERGLGWRWGLAGDGKWGPPVQTTLWEALCAGRGKEGKRAVQLEEGLGSRRSWRSFRRPEAGPLPRAQGPSGEGYAETRGRGEPTLGKGGQRGGGLGQEEPAPQEPSSGPLPAGSHRSGPRCLLPEAEAAPEAGTDHRPRVQQQLREADPVRRGLLSPEPSPRAEGRLPPGSRG